ncbi:hypothetical protein PGT21_030611 [Puccinia graminis f. sp. tritici]|uniref:Uncharacterized protein n=1 Tax=Puccinia graminis f. sp. tritici TaxID=56615 RepID=A0A5B0MQ55_PUCGR|nr:hypothetical protein PGT21_030611 [Puccinia graminis f. sp. tritici]KAA1078543.1 hypothetical protein PGTUg99_010128 [Puccinia graminis f. sp. tritici]
MSWCVGHIATEYAAPFEEQSSAQQTTARQATSASRRVSSSLEYLKAASPALLWDSSFSSSLHESHPHPNHPHPNHPHPNHQNSKQLALAWLFLTSSGQWATTPSNRNAAMGPAPNSAPAAVAAFPRSPPLSAFPAASPHFHLPSRLRPTAQVTRSNAIRRPAAASANLSLNDIDINGDLVNKALGLTPTSPAPPLPLTSIPPMKTSSVDYSTLPLPPLPLPPTPPAAPPLPLLPFPRPPRRARVTSNRNAMIILVPQDLPQELRDIQLDSWMTQDDDST